METQQFIDALATKTEHTIFYLGKPKSFGAMQGCITRSFTSILLLSVMVCLSGVSSRLIAAEIGIVEQGLFLHDDAGFATQLGAGEASYFSTLDSNHEGTFGWTYTNIGPGTLSGFRLFGFLDADIDRPLNTFFNEYGEMVAPLTAPPGAPAGSIAATSWQIDEPGFVFGTVITDMQSGFLRNRNFVPKSAPDDVSLALGFYIGSLLPDQQVTAVFSISRNPIGGLRQIDPDSPDAFFFNGYAEVGTVNPVTPEPSTSTLFAVALLAFGGFKLRSRR